MKISTARFGELEIEESKIITMPDGMVGFNERSFTILHPENGGPFCWLQAIDNPDLAFVVVDPVRFVPGYEVKLMREECDRLQLEPGDETVLLCVVTMAPDPRKITVNLQGPIVINSRRMVALQMVLENTYACRHVLFEPQKPAPQQKTQQSRLSLNVPLTPSLYSCLGLAAA